MRNFAPQSRQFDERKIVREQKNFIEGAFDDIPGSGVPPAGVKLLTNYRCLPDGTLEPRNGTKLWSTLGLPAIPGKTGLSVTKSGATVTLTGATFDVDDAGRYIVYDDGTHEQLIVAEGGEASATVENNTPHAASTAAYIRGAVKGWFYHKGKDRIVIQLDSYFYVADGAMTSWVQVQHIGGVAAIRPNARTGSHFQELNNKVLAFNVRGIFCIDLDFNPNSVANQYCYYRINSVGPTSKIVESYNETYDHQYRYLYSMSRLRGFTYTGDRTTDGVSIDHQSGTVKWTAASNDYSRHSVDNTPIGPGTQTNKVLTGGTLLTSIAALSVVSDAQFKITIDGTLQNIQVNFTGCTTWVELAEVLSLGIRDFFPLAKCEFDTDHFVFTNTNPDGSISYTQAGDGGTDIGATHLQCASGQGTLSTPTKDAAHTIANSSGPQSPSAKHWTHYSIWRTLDLGSAGVDPVTGQGNQKALYVWVADIAVMKPFMATRACTDETVGNYTITSATSVFTASDVGATFITTDCVDISGDPVVFTITAYTSATVVTAVPTVLATSPLSYVNETAMASAIGVGNTSGVIKASQTGTTITRTAGANFTSSDVGKTIWWADGGVSVITAVGNDGTPSGGITATAGWSASHADQAACHTPTQRGFTDNVSDEDLRNRTATLSLPNRFWQNIPTASDCGTVSSGFMLAGTRAAKRLYYSELPNGMEYLYGYCNLAEQTITVKDLITAVDSIQNMALVLCYNSIIGVPLNTFLTKTIEEVGEVVVVLTGQITISPDIGCIDFGSIRSVDSLQHVFMSSDNELRLLQYTGDGIRVSEGLAKNRFQKRLARSAGMTAVSYDRFSGLILWLRTSANPLASIQECDGLGISTNDSIQYAILPEQGVGFSVCDGSDWVMPPAQVGNLVVYDSDKLARSIVIDNSDGKVYDISQRDGAASSSLTKIWKDKVSTTGTGGTDIVPSIVFGEDEGSLEHHFLEHLESHIGVRPYKESNRNDTGYDSLGYPTGIEFKLEMFADGEPDTASVTAEDILVTGDIVFDKPVRAHRLQMKLTANKGDHLITSRTQYYKDEDVADSPANRTTTEMTHQAAFAEPAFWALGFNGVVKDLSTGANFTGNYNMLAAGPDGANSAITVAGESGIAAPFSVGLAGDFSIMFLLNSLTATSTIITIGVLTITVTKVASVYSVNFNDGTNNITQALTWDGSGWRGVCVKRSGTNLIIMEGTAS